MRLDLRPPWDEPPNRAEQDLLNQEDPLLRELSLFRRRLVDPRQALERSVMSPEKWLNDAYYSGDLGAYDELTRTGCWPATRRTFLQATEPGIQEIIATGALGTGKSDLVPRLVPYWLYELSCYASPQALLGLQEHSVILFLLVHMNKQRAQRKLYGPVMSAIRRIPYFQECFRPNPKIESYLQFPKGIELRCGVTDPEAIRSEDLAVLVVDEANFLDVTSKSSRDKEGRTFDAAETIYETACRRQLTRFTGTSLWTPKRVLLSSRDRPDDFLERREREVRAGCVIEGPPEDQVVRSKDGGTILFSKALWAAKPPGSFSAKTFRVQVGAKGIRSRVLFANDEPEPKARTIDVPDDEELRAAFLVNCDEALRELAGIAVAGIGRLIPDPRHIEAIWVPGEHPFTRLTTTLLDGACLLPEVLFQDGAPKCCPTRWRFIHIDLASTGDSLGFAVVHVHGSKVVLRPHPDVKGEFVKRPESVFRADLVLQVNPPEGGQIRQSLVQNLVLDLRDGGTRIGKVSVDSPQATKLLQDMEDEGIDAAKRSVDRDPEPYLNLRDAIQEVRFECYRYPVLGAELEGLLWYPHLRKVDHPSNRAKDVSDAVAGAVANAIESPWAASDQVGASVSIKVY